MFNPTTHFGTGTIGFLLPPGREPVVVVIYITETNASFGERDLAIAEIGRGAIALGI